MNQQPSRAARLAALAVPALVVAAVSIIAPIASGPIASGADGDYTSTDPARLLDTRTTTGAATIDGDDLGAGRVVAGSVTTVGVAGRGTVAASATSAMVNVTAVNPSDTGFLTVFACDDDQPTASNLNFYAGTTVANAVFAPIGSDDHICIYSSAATDLLVDVNGYAEEGSPVPIASARLTDTRTAAPDDATIDGDDVGAGQVAADSTKEIDVVGRGDVPADAQSAILNVTAVNPTSDGYLTVYSCDTDVPTSSNVNFTAGTTIARTAAVSVSADGTVCVYTSAATDLVVDVDGYVPTDAEPVTVEPVRLLDTRSAGTTADGQYEAAGRVAAGSTTPVEATDRSGIPDSANVVLLSVTAVNPSDGGYLTVYACGGDAPLASNVNFSAGQTVPNFVAIAVSDADEVCVYSSAATHLVVDASGYFSEAVVTTTSTTTTTTVPTPGLDSCEDKAALFTTKGSANSNLADPESSATCVGDTIVTDSNGIPDYTYIQTSPGDPAPQDLSFEISASPTLTGDTSPIALLGPVAVALNGVPIYGATEGTGGDVLSLGGALSECGSHNGPTGFHMHLLGTSATTDCIFTPAEVASGPQLLGFAFDGFPIYTGNDQYESSWELTDASLFATDTWSAHTYVPGSGDLDECNGRTDAEGNYAYYTTDTFPYVLGCYSGDYTATTTGGGGGPGGPRR